MHTHARTYTHMHTHTHAHAHTHARTHARTHAHAHTVSLLKRAQIFTADVWSRFDKKGYGEFHDIDKLTMFPDYRCCYLLDCCMSM